MLYFQRMWQAISCKTRQDAQSTSSDRPSACPVVRYALLAFGWCNIGLGGLGLLLPLMPTTIFLLIALWAFSKSSPGLRHWLYTHPLFGPTLRAWCDNRVIPRRGKVLAVIMMSASVLYVTLFVASSWTVPVLLTAVLIGVATYILTRPSQVRKSDETQYS